MNIEELYRAVIMEHYKNPRNKGLITDDGYEVIHLNNPSCGDDIKVSLKVENNKIVSITHEGKGCSICCSSASVMSETLIGKTIDEAKEIIEEFFELVQGKEIGEKAEENLGEAVAYVGVSRFPARIKCATLSWKACYKGLSEVKND